MTLPSLHAKQGRSRVCNSAVFMQFFLLLATVEALPNPVDIPSVLVTRTRRLLNMNGLTRPYNKESYPYDRIMGHPVFQVTTPWGSAYMNMEKLDLEAFLNKDDNSDEMEDVATGKATLASDSNQYRTISLYFMDPDDALAAHAEFLQMEQMQKSDIRVTTVSLAKALRSASHLGRGLLTGQPIDALKGKVLSTKDGGSLRHKIMPPKKQLFYAARCHGKERVGLFGSNSASSMDAANRELAVTAVLGNSALSLRNLQRRQAQRDRKIKRQPKNDLEAKYAHMDGHLGIPVFYSQGLVRRYPLWKRFVSGIDQETPLFFNYEDLQMAWQKSHSAKNKKPTEPTVEVFNLWDVLTSMDKDQDRQRLQAKRQPPTKQALHAILQPLRRRAKAIAPLSTSIPADLDSIVFVPSSDACTYKERMTAKGNGKARLRPMR